MEVVSHFMSHLIILCGKKERQTICLSISLTKITYPFSQTALHVSCQLFKRPHVLLENKIRIGKISSLPASISKINTNFDNQLKSPKLQVGPTASSPGPILLKQDRTAVILVVIENLSIDTKIKLINKIIT